MVDDRKDITIEDNDTATWTLSAIGDMRASTYIGKFRFKCFLNPTDKIAANREYRELLGANPTLTPEHESLLAYALTQLKYRVVSAPPFWTQSVGSTSYAGDIPDENIITTVLNAAIDSEVKYKNTIKKRTEEALKRARLAAERQVKLQNESAKEDDDEQSEDEETSS